jgi:hypothetical protein
LKYYPIRNSNKKTSLIITVVLASFLLLGGAAFAVITLRRNASNDVSEEVKQNNTTITSAASASAFPSISPTASASAKPIINTVSNNTPVHCAVDSKCGEGTTPLTQLECKNSICCQVNQNEWRVIIGNDACLEAQNVNNFIPRELMTSSFSPKSVNQGKNYKCIDEKISDLRNLDDQNAQAPDGTCQCPSQQEIEQRCTKTCEENHPMYACLDACAEENKCECSIDLLIQKKRKIELTQQITSILSKYCYEVQ